MKELEIINPKEKKVVPVINVWRNMTVKQLAQSAGRPVDDVLEALFFVDNQNIYEASSIFEDSPILHETVRKLGAKFKVISAPSKVKDEEEDGESHDVVKR